MPNCPGAKLSGAKLSWCQIVRVANCPLLLFWCQIVCFYYLGAKLSVFIILVPSCPLYYLGAKLSGAKLSGAKLSALLSWCQIVRCQIVWCQIVLPPFSMPSSYCGHRNFKGFKSILNYRFVRVLGAVY